MQYYNIILLHKSLISHDVIIIVLSEYDVLLQKKLFIDYTEIEYDIYYKDFFSYFLVYTFRNPFYSPIENIAISQWNMIISNKIAISILTCDILKLEKNFFN